MKERGESTWFRGQNGTLRRSLDCITKAEGYWLSSTKRRPSLMLSGKLPKVHLPIVRLRLFGASLGILLETQGALESAFQVNGLPRYGRLNRSTRVRLASRIRNRFVRGLTHTARTRISSGYVFGVCFPERAKWSLSQPPMLRKLLVAKR